MSAAFQPNIRVRVDVTNPGQFFACCGLLELVGRISPGAESRFENGFFLINAAVSFEAALEEITSAPLSPTDAKDQTASPIHLGGPFKLRLDWWKTDDRGSLGLKVWAGKMESCRIARAMQQAMRAPEFQTENLFNVGAVAYDPNDVENKVEPFYFDARRGPNAHSRDVGFSVNDLGVTTKASPSVEFLCLVGLQRAQPVPTDEPRVYDYYAWSIPVSASLLPAAVGGFLERSRGYRFESWYRTSQRKHKAFLRANPITT